ncbi:Homeobox protein [Actinidia chinensis var. chinensis]|uniref:Homeobox protein n=1 Tax=Actinidia chinensis var. chinensis TaxID=1590841 RepID=A0A2R6PHE6_ACTCC|nr:Homeobox protein [Actinidia chinensis var. chinensis]
MAENDAFNVPTDVANRNAIFMDGLFAHVTSISPARPNSLNLNNQYHIMGEFPALSMLQGEPTNNLHTGFPISNHAGLIDCGTSAPSEPLVRNAQERFVGGTPISASSIAAILAAQCGPRDNMNELPSSTPSANPLEISKNPVLNDYPVALNSAFATSVNCGYDGLPGGINNKWVFDKFLACTEVTEVPGITGFQPCQLVGNVSVNANGWTSLDNANLSSDNRSSSSKFSNELSLSLATSCQPSIIRGTTTTDQCSEISCSGVTSSCNSKKLSLGIGSHGSVQISQFLSGSRYLLVIQEILTEIASYSLENLDLMNYPASRNARFSLSSSGYALMGTERDGRCGAQTDPVLREQEVEAKKKQLLTLLQEVDEQYNQCLDEIHTVISAFHAATELDPHIHARFALQTISSLYKSLRERISNEILTMGGFFNRGDNWEEERSFETSFIQKQWALQQLRRKDHQLWRPQRGLPERSVSVLRAWMFQNFLHPYPKDAEKHLLAVKSGLTRSQVSNWFINARVRLWKPMIEEMYAEMNRRKGRRNVEETENNHRSQVSIDHRRFNKK